MTALDVKALVPRGPTPRDSDIAYLHEMLVAMARPLVDKPDSVMIMTAVGQEFVAFEVHCEEEDGKFLIGSRGSYAYAMRTLLQAAASRLRLRVQVQFLTREQEALGPR